jgi:hypothetical protein
MLYTNLKHPEPDNDMNTATNENDMILSVRMGSVVYYVSPAVRQTPQRMTAKVQDEVAEVK